MAGVVCRVVSKVQGKLRDLSAALRWSLWPPGRNTQERCLLSLWRTEELAPFKGWDYSYLDGRMEEPEPEWDYPGLARTRVRESASVLDIATGGGELFEQILTPRPAARCVAVEGYPPNVPVARDRLSPLGVDVVWAKRVADIPFDDDSFDLVLNRHGGFDAPELRRILQPGGIFLSQQIGAGHFEDLCAHFGCSSGWRGDSRERLPQRLTDAGFELQCSEAWSGQVVFYDVGALVYFLKTMPWLVPDFSVLKFRTELLDLHERCERDGKLEFTCARQLLVARAP